ASARGLERFYVLLIGGEASATDRASFAGDLDLAAALRSRGLVGRAAATGALPVGAVAAHLAAADFVVLPYRDGASWRPGSLLAALAAGVPVLTARRAQGYDAGGPLPALRDGESALLVPPDNADALAGAILRLAGDKPLRDRLAAGALKIAASFDWEAIAR